MICLSFDVEWAPRELVDSIVRLLDERGLKGTFFCTHPGIEVPGHERGLHPNFRPSGESHKSVESEAGSNFKKLGEAELYRRIVRRTKTFAPEAVGVRAHSLHYDSLLPKAYQTEGIQYDSSYFLPLLKNLAPFWKEFDLLEIPTYFIDHFDLKTSTTGFDPMRLGLEEPGLKVLDFHPHMIAINAKVDTDYQQCKPFYDDPEKLRAFRKPGKGIGTLFVDTLDLIVEKKLPTTTLGEINSTFRKKFGK